MGWERVVAALPAAKLVVGLRVDLPHALKVLVEVDLRLVDSFRECVCLLFEIVKELIRVISQLTVRRVHHPLEPILE